MCILTLIIILWSFSSGLNSGKTKKSKLPASLSDFQSKERTPRKPPAWFKFDLNKKYLHGFTVRLNVPYRNVETDGQVHPNGQPFIGLENAGSDAHLGDVGIFLKKKVLDQANSGFGLAVVGAVFLPTGSNEGTFGSDGRISASRPQPPNLTAAQGFDAVQRANVENGIWGDGRCFFSNFNDLRRGYALPWVLSVFKSFNFLFFRILTAIKNEH